MVRDINGINGPRADAAQTDKSRKGKAVEQVADAATSKAAPPGGDSSANDVVELSSEARILKSLEAKLKDLPDVNFSKIAEIKAAIVSGRYGVNAESIAEKMLMADKDFE